MSSFIKIQFPKDFETRYEKYKAGLFGISKPALKEATAGSASELGVLTQNDRPFCVADGKLGYLKFDKFGKKFKVGGINSQPFRLLQCLTEPFGTAKTVDATFEAIRENIKYKSRGGVYTTGIDRPKKVRLIEFAIKELQKDNKLQGKIDFKWDTLKTKIWLEYNG